MRHCKKTTNSRANPMNQRIDDGRSPLDASESLGRLDACAYSRYKCCHDCRCAHCVRPCQWRRQGRKGRFSACAGQRAGSQDDYGADSVRVRWSDSGLQRSRSSRARSGNSRETSVPGRQPRQRRPAFVRARLAAVRRAGSSSRSRACSRAGAILASQTHLRSRQATDRQQRAESARIR